MPTPTIPFHRPDCDIEHTLQPSDQLLIKATAEAKTATCPACATASARIHRHYERKPRDLPLCPHAVRLQLRVRRFRCLNPDCIRRIFVQRLDGLIKPYARRTERLTHALRHIGFALGGRAGARLARALAMPVSGDTLLRLVHRTPLPQMPAPRVVGVDDWAWRKGMVYGTILVDLETHRPIELLPARSAQTLAAWLAAHPAIQILTRDRSPAYAQGMHMGAPKAIQVADRWHLLLNLHELLKRVIEQRHAHIKKLPYLLEDQILIRKPFLRAPSERQARKVKRGRRQKRYEQVLNLRAEGVPLQQIAKRVGLSRVTVHRYVHEGRLPNRLDQAAQASQLDPYLSYLDARYQAGCDHARQRWREITEQGYRGSYRQVCRWMQRRRNEATTSPGLAGAERAEAAKALLSSRRPLAWVRLLDPGPLGQPEHYLLPYLCQDETIRVVYDLAQRFVQMVKGQSDEALSAWQQGWAESGVVLLHRFARQLWRDRSAVEAALCLPWSNAQVEGQITRLKVIKRQMDARAGFTLLRKRVLYRDD